MSAQLINAKKNALAFADDERAEAAFLFAPATQPCAWITLRVARRSRWTERILEIELQIA
jgi:hypothetical protein